MKFFKSNKNKVLLRNFLILFLLAINFSFNKVVEKRSNSTKKSNNTMVLSKNKGLPEEIRAALYIEITNSVTRGKTNIQVDVSMKSSDLLNTSKGIKFYLRNTKDISKLNKVNVLINLKNGVYVMNHRYFTQSLDCTKSTFFSKNGMNLYLSWGSDESYSFDFKFDSSWLFWDSVSNDDLMIVCKGLKNSIDDYRSKIYDIKLKISELLQSALSKQKEQKAKITSKTELQTFINGLKSELEVTKKGADDLNFETEKKKGIVKDYANQISNKQTDLNKFNLEINSLQQKISLNQKTVEMKKSMSGAIKKISQEEVDKQYDEVKSAIDSYSKTYLSQDPYYESLSQLKNNVRVDKENIIAILS